MPLVFRAMLSSDSGPPIGHTSNDTLGAREQIVLPDGKVNGDILCADGLVKPNTGGMSVSPSKETCPLHLIPKEKRDRYPGARRNNKPPTYPWKLGEGEFRNGTLCGHLALNLENDTHGFVEPDTEMTLHEYRVAIEATQKDWVREDW